jgi:hypothetical protein
MQLTVEDLLSALDAFDVMTVAGYNGTCERVVRHDALVGALKALIEEPSPPAAPGLPATALPDESSGQGYATARLAESPEAADGSREDFEAFMRWSRAGSGRKVAENMLNRDGPNYASDSTQRHWWTWQHARTALLAGRLGGSDVDQ